MDKSQIEASDDLGANGFQTFFKVTEPKDRDSSEQNKSCPTTLM